MEREQRIRITFSKTKAMQFTGHLDLRRAWTRTFRRAEIALTYSSGYTPRPQFNLAAPLPLGFLSTHELGDFWLEKRYSIPFLMDRLTGSTPPGMEINNVEEIPEIHGEKLPNLVNAADYQAIFLTPLPSLPDRVKDFLREDEIIRTRKGDRYDLRPLIQHLHLLPPIDEIQQRLEMKLTMLPGATGRPDEVVSEICGRPHSARYIRTKIYLDP